MKHDIDFNYYTETYLGKVGELTLKGGNMRVFEKQLVLNLRLALETVEARVWTQAGRLYVSCTKDSIEYLLIISIFFILFF